MSFQSEDYRYESLCILLQQIRDEAEDEGGHGSATVGPSRLLQLKKDLHFWSWLVSFARALEQKMEPVGPPRRQSLQPSFAASMADPPSGEEVGRTAESCSYPAAAAASMYSMASCSPPPSTILPSSHYEQRERVAAPTAAGAASPTSPLGPSSFQLFQMDKVAGLPALPQQVGSSPSPCCTPEVERCLCYSSSAVDPPSAADPTQSFSTAGLLRDTSDGGGTSAGVPPPLLIRHVGAANATPVTPREQLELFDGQAGRCGRCGAAILPPHSSAVSRLFRFGASCFKATLHSTCGRLLCRCCGGSDAEEEEVLAQQQGLLLFGRPNGGALPVTAATAAGIFCTDTGLYLCFNCFWNSWSASSLQHAAPLQVPQNEVGEGDGGLSLALSGEYSILSRLDSSLSTSTSCSTAAATAVRLPNGPFRALPTQVLPSHVLRKWDFSQYPVSVASFERLQRRKKQQQPLILYDISAINPLLYAAVPPLAAAAQLRGAVCSLDEQLSRCPHYRSEVWGLNARNPPAPSCSASAAISAEEQAAPLPRPGRCSSRRRYLVERREGWSMADLHRLHRSGSAVSPSAGSPLLGELQMIQRCMKLHARGCDQCSEAVVLSGDGEADYGRGWTPNAHNR